MTDARWWTKVLVDRRRFPLYAEQAYEPPAHPHEGHEHGEEEQGRQEVLTPLPGAPEREGRA